jgi:uncharacterized protein
LLSPDCFIIAIFDLPLDMDLNRFREKAKNKSTENKKFLQTIRKKDARDVDDAFHKLHDEVFEEIDCLTCANCCKTTSPIFYQTDIERVAKALRIKPGDFIEQYLRVDEDKDYVLILQDLREQTKSLS